MKGDFSRIRFNPAKQYTAVLQQQGRVALDADANEEAAIEGHLRETINVDVIGQFGGPMDDAGFALMIQGEEILIVPGRYYVDGILVENPRPLNYDLQPYLVGPGHTAKQLLTAVADGRTVQFRLEVWHRLVTELDDTCLQEPALGQADTTARLQTVWRVVGSIESKTSGTNTYTPDPTDPVSRLAPCCQLMYAPSWVERTGSLGVDTNNAGDDCGCDPIPAAGYQGLENQLYRVEIHAPGDLSTATFKWSRENGSVVAQVLQASGPVITVSSLGPDANLGFLPGQWVELSDDDDLFGETPNQPGTLYQILSTTPATLQVTLASPVTGLDTSRNARMRRWEQNGATATSVGVPLSSTAIPLENGIEVTFRKGSYQTGDYWTIPARTAKGSIEWPPCGGNGALFQPADFTQVHVAPLACVHLRSKVQSKDLHTTAQVANRFAVDDCRLLFPPLTALQENTVEALHVSAASWTNDDVMTVDTLLEQGLSVTLDQAPNCPWSGGNFRVTLETPLANDPIALYQDALVAMQSSGKLPAGTDVFLRTELVLDPPEGISVSGSQVNWLLPAAKTGVQMYSAYWLYLTLNTLLVASKTTGYGRVRIKLQGGAVYTAGSDGNNIYLDGTGFGATGTRSSDGNPSVLLSLPTGNMARSSDFESWFYLAPTVLIAGVAIQAVESGNAVSANAVTVVVNSQGAMTGLETTAGAAPTTISAVQAVITLTYAPVADTPIALTLSGNGVGSVVTVQATATVPKGQNSVTVPIHIQSSPGVGTTDSVTLAASVSTALGNVPWNQPPSLAITGGTYTVVFK